MTTRLAYRAIALMLLAPALSLLACGDKKTEGTGGGDSAAANTTATDGGMTAEETTNIDLTRQFIEKAINNGDTAFAREHTDPAFVEHNLVPGQKPGFDGFLEWLAMNRVAFPDFKITINDIFAKGDRVVMLSTMTGTNSGPMMGQPATNKSMKVDGVDIIRIKNGKMTDHWGQIDAMKMMTDLGMMPPMGAPPPAAGDAATQAPAEGEAKKDSAK